MGRVSFHTILNLSAKNIKLKSFPVHLATKDVYTVKSNLLAMSFDLSKTF